MAEKLISVQPHRVVPTKMLYMFVTEDGQANHNAVGDYSLVPVNFKTPKIIGLEALHVSRIIVFLCDAGNFKTNLYGAMGKLDNGVRIVVRDNDNNLIGPAAEAPPGSSQIKTNADWMKIGGHIEYDSDWRDGETAYSAVIEFPNSALELRDGDHLSFELSDDFTGLLEHTFVIQGYLGR